MIMGKLIKTIKLNITNKVRIGFPEGGNPKIVEAAKLLKKEGKINPVLIVKTKEQITDDSLEWIVIDEYEHKQKIIELLFELRKAKGMTLENASKLISLPNYFTTMLLKIDEIDGYVGGIEYTTADTLRPTLQIIKTKPDSKIVSSVFVLEKEEESLLFGDCAINLKPNSQQLADISKQILKFGKTTVGLKDIRLALLSYSTNGSGKGDDVQKVADTYKILKQDNVKEAYGEIQFDAAYVDSVRKQKAKDNTWEKSANAFVFPDLNSGNIGYKIAQRLGGYEAIGPILLGVAKPVNDLSRGASIEDIVNVAYITAAQKEEQ
ncbi:MAG: phosphate acetyltransferase [Mycoplasma sp.]|nr:phosphate acetyltransferase [Mycoplasma sp.]